VQTYDDSILQISGGTVARDAMAFESSQIALHSGAVIDDLRSFDDAVVLVFGGSVGAGIIEASGSSVINIEGGQIFSDLHAQDSAIIQVFGTNLVLSNALLTGTLLDGTPISQDATTSGDGLIILHNVPEPSSLFMLATGLLFATAALRRGANKCARA
jgi:hypothetical protein